MGLFSFLKDTGAKLFGGQTSAEKAEEAAINRSNELKRQISNLNLGLEDVHIEVQGDKVSISGVADSQAEREKAILTVGNVHGVATVSDNITVEKDEPESKFVTVEKGDTLSKIAKREYGDPMKYPVIFEANKPMLSDPDKIYPGQVLRVPPVDMA